MEYVTDDRRLEEVAQALHGAAILAADTEAAGYHRYHDRACLLQLSTPTETFLVDPFAVERMETLAPVLADPATEVIFHDADYDLRLLHRDFGITVNNLFDTKIAAQFLGEPAIGLASLAEKYLGIRLAKKYQRADWAQRPLPPEMLDYAAEDTRYLPELREKLRAELIDKGRLAWAEEEFEIASGVRWAATPDPDAFMRLKGTRDLQPRELAVLREVYAWREAVAEARDAATFRVVSNDTLLELSRRMPTDLRALAETPGVPRWVTDRHGDEVLAAVRRALELPREQLPVRERGPRRPPPDPEFEAAVDRLRAARDEVAQGLGLDRGFLMPRSQLEEIARAQPRDEQELAALPSVRRWQVEAAGDAILDALRG